LAGHSYGLHDVGLRRLNTPVNDVFRVTSSTGDFALKLYHRNRTAEAVEWEADLVAYLHAHGAPVVRPIGGRDGYWLRDRLSDPALDRGVCHMDLTLDNVHLIDHLIVFDFDSAGTCWRAGEPWGVLKSSACYFQAWVAGYRAIRTFSTADEAAVAAFGILGDLRVTAWKLGVAASSRGSPLLDVEDLPTVVEGWLNWEATHLAP
jgi:Ser/Thr protein kinase RdoA (MazF antagonist)